MSERAAKQQKLDLAALPANVIIQFQSPEGDATGKHRRRRCVCSAALLGAGFTCDVCILILAPTLPLTLCLRCYQTLTLSPQPLAAPCCPAGPQLDLPHDVTPSQLETLLNGLLQSDEKLPYSFFVEDQELAAELGLHLLKHKARGVDWG